MQILLRPIMTERNCCSNHGGIELLSVTPANASTHIMSCQSHFSSPADHHQRIVPVLRNSLRQVEPMDLFVNRESNAHDVHPSAFQF